jgi:hypothetical protein
VRVLTLRELNRALLARQLLLERARLPVLDALERVAGLQAQEGKGPYTALPSRLEGFERGELEEALVARKALRAVLMRNTIHLVTAADYRLMRAAVYGDETGLLRGDARAVGERHAAAARRFFGTQPRTRAEVVAWLEAEHGLEDAPLHWYALRAAARIAHTPECGLWKGKRIAFEALPEADEPEPAAARAALLRRYLAAFGPASVADYAAWTGLRIREARAAAEAAGPLERYADEHGRELLDVAGAPLPAADSPAPARLLARWDNAILAHADRSRILPPGHRLAVDDGGAAYQVFLVDGFAAGTWRLDRGKAELVPYGGLPRTAQRELADEARRLEELVRNA